MSKTVVNVILLILSIGLAVAGQLSMKAGMNKVGEIKSVDLKHPFELIGSVIKSAWAVIGVLLYAISAVFWLVVLSRVNLSVAYPIVAVGYVVVVLYSWLVFKEPVKWFTWVGLAFIVMGVVITAQGLKSETPNESSNLKAPTAKVAAASGDASVKNETGIGNTD